MKTALILAYVSLMTAPVAFAADDVLRHFSDNTFVKSKPVQMIGAPRSSENVARENQVNSVMAYSGNSFRHCFEKMLSREPIRDIQTTFFFEINEQGLIQNISADLHSGNPDVQAVRDLLNCSASRMRTLRFPQAASKQTFRFLLSFKYD